MAFKDLREFLGALEAKGELQRIKAEVDWDEEMAAIAQETIARKGPALLFENIKDHKESPGKKVSMLTDATLSRVRISLGLPDNTPTSEMVRLWRQRSKNPIKPILVSTGSCKENIQKGDEVNLLDFPVPKLHPLDGGRYILTWHIIVTKDPETGWVNLGTYRGMVLDRNSIGVLYTISQHWGAHGSKYKAMGKPMPVVAAIGLEPITMVTSSTSWPEGVCEYDIAGAMRGEPLTLVKAETVDLEIPADSEIVLEGEMSLDPKTFRPEGPFGEYPGHYSTLRSDPKPVFKVNCVTYRRDPILTVAAPGISPRVSADLPGNEGDRPHQGIASSAITWDTLERAGVRGVTGVSSAGPGGMISIISINQQYFGHARQVAAALWTTSSGKYVIVVDSDIDIHDLQKVFLAIANRTQGRKDIVIYPDTIGASLDPGILPEIKRARDGLSSWDRVLIDATWPYEWEPRAEWGGLKHPPGCRATPEKITEVRKRWAEYGFKI